MADTCRYPATTLSRLYEAQKQHPKAEPVLTQQQPPPVNTTATQKSTLHSFWKIGTRPHSNADIQMGGVQPKPVHDTGGAKCEDCDSTIQGEDSMDVDDGTVDHEAACSRCRRLVCDRCAVLGNERICLACATGR